MEEVLNKFERINVEQFLCHSQMLWSSLEMDSKQVSNCVYFPTIFALILFRRFLQPWQMNSIVCFSAQQYFRVVRNLWKRIRLPEAQFRRTDTFCYVVVFYRTFNTARS